MATVPCLLLQPNLQMTIVGHPNTVIYVLLIIVTEITLRLALNLFQPYIPNIELVHCDEAIGKQVLDTTHD